MKSRQFPTNDVRPCAGRCVVHNMLTLLPAVVLKSATPTLKENPKDANMLMRVVPFGKVAFLVLRSDTKKLATFEDLLFLGPRLTLCCISKFTHMDHNLSMTGLVKHNLRWVLIQRDAQSKSGKIYPLPIESSFPLLSVSPFLGSIVLWFRQV